MRIRNFHAALDVLPDSSLDVTETIRVEFIGAWQGLYRTIPVEYPGPAGFNYSLILTDITATEERGASPASKSAATSGSTTSLRIERRRQGANLELKIYVPNADSVTRTISLHYMVRNGLRYFPDHDDALLEHYRHRVGRAPSKPPAPTLFSRPASPACAPRITQAFSVRARRTRR